MKIILTLAALWLSWFVIRIINLEINHRRKPCVSGPVEPYYDQFANALASTYAMISNGDIPTAECEIRILGDEYPEFHEDIADLRAFLHERKQQL